MNFREAFDAMRHGKKVKLPWWDGYWAFEHGDIIMHCRDGVARSIMESELPEYTYMNIASDEFEIVDEPKSDTEKENSNDLLIDDREFDFNGFASKINDKDYYVLLLSMCKTLNKTHADNTSISFTMAMYKLLENKVVSRKSWNSNKSTFKGNLDRYVFIDTLDNGTKLIKETKLEGSNEKTMNYYPSTEDIISNDWFVAYTIYEDDKTVTPISDTVLNTKNDSSNTSITSGFDIHTAINYLLNGKSVTREKWLKENKGKYINGITLNNNLVIFLFEKQYRFTTEDILSNDWMLYESNQLK